MSKTLDETVRLQSEIRREVRGERLQGRDVEAEAGSGGSSTFSVEVEARKIHRFRFYIGGKNGEREEIGSAILRRRTNGGSINIKK